MEAKMVKLFDSVVNFFGGGDQIPWSDSKTIADLERAVAETNVSEEQKSSSIMRWCWALVHSKQPLDVQLGITMLQAALSNDNDNVSSSPLEKREKLYLLAVGYYRSGDYSRSRQTVEQCLEIAADWKQPLTLEKTIKDKITKEGVIGMGIAATAVALIVGGIASSVARKK